MNISVLVIFFLWVLATAFWWAFAFLQLPGPTPDWLLEAKAVCFGQTITGLPDAEGWRTLFFPPFFMLASFLFVFWHDFKKSIKSFLLTTKGKIFTTLICLVLLFESLAISKIIWQRWPSATLGNEVTGVLPEGYPQTHIEVKNFALVNQDNKPFTQANFKNKKTILTFAFANCDTICPLVVNNCVGALKHFDQKDYQLVIITLDPWRDSPSRLKAAAKMWSTAENTSLLSGEIDIVLSVLADFNVPIDRNEKTGFVTHPALVYVLDENGEIAFSFNNPSVQWLKDALKQL